MEKQNLEPNNIELKNRKNLKISGVNQVISATPQEVLLKTSGGPLSIIGSDITIKSLNEAEKLLEIEGNINQIKYTEKKKKILQKLFK